VKLLHFPQCRPIAAQPVDSVGHPSEPGRSASLTAVNFRRIVFGILDFDAVSRGNERSNFLL